MNFTKPVPLYIYIYAVLLTLFTTLMVGWSIIAPTSFFGAYGIVGDQAFQYSWSFRYFIALAVMILCLICRSPEAIFLAIFCRFLVDLFDTIGIFRFNTPPFDLGSFMFQAVALLGLQIFSMIRLFPLLSKRAAA